MALIDVHLPLHVLATDMMFHEQLPFAIWNPHENHDIMAGPKPWRADTPAVREPGCCDLTFGESDRKRDVFIRGTNPILPFG